MSRTAAWVVLMAVGTATATDAAGGQLPVAVPSDAGAPLMTTNATLRESLERIAAGSALWREEVEAVRKSGRRALVVTSDQVVISKALDADEVEAFDTSVLAEVAPVPRGNDDVDVVLVVVNLALLETVHGRKRSLPGEFKADLDRILVHEIYGHALPYLLSGNLSGRCADPLPRQPASEACSIRRENAVRAELRLGRRTDYGLHGLAAARSEFP